jgi:hypothetical protein
MTVARPVITVYEGPDRSRTEDVTELPRSLPAACPRRNWPPEAGLTPVRKMVPGCQADGRRTKATRRPSDSAEVAVTAARAATGAPRTAPTATSSSRPSRPPSSHPSARSGAGGSPRAAARVLGRHRQQRPGGRGHGQHQHPSGAVPVQRPQSKPGQDGRVATRSSTPSSSAPRGPPRSWSRASSPSTPSVTELACTSRAPARPWPAASRAALARPNVNATSYTRSGAGRSGARSIDSRVDSGRLMKRLTGPSASLPSERRNATLAARASWGVSTSCHQQPAGRATARRGRIWARPVTAPARPWSPSEAAWRWRWNTSGGSRNVVDRRLIQVLTERDDSPLHHPDSDPLRPGQRAGGGVDKHGWLTGRQQPVQPTRAEDVVGGNQRE